MPSTATAPRQTRAKDEHLFASAGDIVAAVAAVVGVIVAAIVLVDQVRARRPLLYVNFSGSAGRADEIELTLTIRNDSNTTVERVRSVLLLDGSPVEGLGFGPTTLPAHEQLVVYPALRRPDLADLEPGGKLTFHGKRLSVKLTFGSRGAAEVEYGEARSVR